MRPGTRALAFAARWFAPTVVHRTFEPLIADWQREWTDAPPSRRQLVRWRGALSLVVTFVACSPTILRVPTPSAVADQVARRASRFTLVGTSILLLPALFSVDLDGRWYLLLFQAPAAMVLIFPFATIGAADEIRTRDGLPPHVARAVATKLALFSVVAMIVYGGFVVPAGNYAWRVATSGAREQPPVAGVRELSTLTLLSDPQRVPVREAFTGGRDRAARIRAELQRRASMALLPLTLLWLRWVALGAPHRLRPLPTAAAVSVAFAVFFISFFAGWRLEIDYLPGSGLGAWVPLVALIVLHAVATKIRKHGVGLA